MVDVVKKLALPENPSQSQCSGFKDFKGFISIARLLDIARNITDSFNGILVS